MIYQIGEYKKGDFYCENCKLDQTLFGYEAVEGVLDVTNMMWTPFIDSVKYLVAKCEKCNQELKRYLTYRHRDPYYYKSKYAIMMRRKYSKDLIQPTDPRFQSLYPKQYEEMKKKEEKLVMEEKEKKREKESFYTEALRQGAKKKVVNKVMEIEEKI